ncbi:hypothetical protein DN752_24200 [Echinicola strongylocentroti]|uniref:DUF3253 domain-containing protein n=1 Tax=Echinicola strongylocentroti TaxID=1795355 RepID=A0A2Z4IRP4_9BACT|nr:hypothetical protein [Echinicola strongylocentroti]AWW32973.1 hypothetical protein DN752_24200 [Echinicola strongylocentroti]
MDTILEIAILEMGRQKGDMPFTCEDVVRWIYPQDWRHFKKDVQFTADHLEEKGRITLSGQGEIRIIK